MIIRTTVKKFDTSCTTSSNLTENGYKMPAIRKMMEYAEPRMLTTMIVSGARSPYDVVGNKVKTKIGTIPDGQLIGDSAYRYQIMGRIQRKSSILALVGTPTSDGWFSLRMKDNQLYPGMNVQFYDGTVARVMGTPTGSSSTGGGYVYNFQTSNGALFSYAAAVTAMTGEKFVMGGYTTYGEASKRGYSRSYHPETYINHMSIQRKGFSLTGSALSDVVWIAYQQDKGWYFQRQRTARIQFMMENEHSKLFSRSTMKDANGELRSTPTQYDEEGNPIIVGDGLIPQIEDGNVAFGSGSDGYATIDDHMDMIKQLKVYSTTVWGEPQRWVCVTGTEGYLRARAELVDYWKDTFGGNHTVNGQQLGDVVVGGNFDTFTMNGVSVTFVEHPMFSDPERWPARGSDGDPLQGGMYLYMEMSRGENGKSNVEILTKGAYGANRSLVEASFNGMTGWSEGGKPVTSTDAFQFELLKEDMIIVYNPKACGIIYRTPM